MQVLPAILESCIILSKLRLDRKISRALLFFQNLTEFSAHFVILIKKEISEI